MPPPSSYLTCWVAPFLGVQAGAAEGAIDASNMLKPALARGELRCMGATTLDEYRKYIEKDAGKQATMKW